MSDSGFVLAVCGGERHLARLDEARSFLAAFSRRPVWVVTDPRRNARPVDGSRVVEVETPRDLDDAGAAIWLKSSLPELLAGPAPRCYLDSDVLAISAAVDSVFDAFAPPATFASDLPSPGANLRRFSRHAIACACREEGERLERFFARLDSLTELHRRERELAALDDPGTYRGARFEGERRRGRWWNGVARGQAPDGALRFEQEFAGGDPVVIRYSFPGSEWLFEKREGESRGLWRHGAGGALRWVGDDATGHWEDERGDSFQRLSGEDGAAQGWWFRSGEPRRRWLERAGHDHGGIWVDAEGGDLGECDHLAEALEESLGVVIADRAFVPWNGGVFLYSDASRPLFAEWRRALVATRADPRFVARDQGALVAAAHRLGLEGHARLPGRFNRIVDRRARDRPSLADLVDRERAAFVHLIDGGLDGARPELAAELRRHRAAHAGDGG